MLSARSLVRTSVMLALLGAAACSGSINCNGCAGGPLLPIPGGFDPAAQIERAAQIRLSGSGFDFIEGEFKDLLTAFVSMECGNATDVPCPTDFVTVPGGAPNPSTCSAADEVCVETLTGQPGPLIGFEIEYSEQSGATICRDDITDPNRRRCYAWLRFEGLGLAPRGPNIVDATITAQIYSSVIPFYYDSLGMDCIVSIDSAASGSVLQDIVATAEIKEWSPPAGTGGRQLQIAISSVDAMIPDTDITIERDPVHGTLGDVLLCGFANLGVVKSALIPRLTGSLAEIVGEEIGKALGMQCVGPNAAVCPSATHCNVDGLCEEDASGNIVPTVLGIEGRMDFAALLGGLTSGRPGQGDISFLVGGQSSADTGGLSIGMLGGAEVVTPDPTCATIEPSPRLRPGWTAPPQLPNAESVDLDFDGTAETPYMLAAGVSEALLDQFLWTVYTDGLFCQSISAYDIDLLNTGSLALLVPSLAQLTHSDRRRYAIYPARVSLHPRAEPQITIGSGEVDNSGTTPVLVDPLLNIFLDEMEVNFFALIEERWVQLMTVTLDMTLGVGVDITPANQIQPVLGDVSMALSEVRVTNSEILAEDPAELAMAIPSLIQIALPQITSALPSFALPNGSELGGFELTVLGVRGVEAGAGVYPNLAIYADLGFDPSLVPPLTLSAETEARVLEVRLPAPEKFAVSAPGGPETPEVVLQIGARVAEGQAVEAQVRIDGSLWTPFFKVRGGAVSIRRPELLVEGHHRFEVRARVSGDYKTLDPSPVSLDVVIDAQPPQLDARLAYKNGGIFVGAFDTVSQDRVRIELGLNGVWREVTPDENELVLVQELEDPGVTIAVAAVDEAGRRSELVLREGQALSAEPTATPAASSTGCVCVTGDAGSDAYGALALMFVALVAVFPQRHARRR